MQSTKAKTSEDFQALVDRYGRLLRAAIQKTVSSRNDLSVDDIEQEARIKVWKALEKGVSIDNPATYLYRVAVNATLDALRRARSRREESLEAPTLGGGPEQADQVVIEAATITRTPEDSAISGDLLGHVQTCMAALGDNRRRAVGLHLQGFNTKEIGELLGWSEAKARNLVYRGIKSLRDRLHKNGIDYDG